MRIVIEKGKRTLYLLDGDTVLLAAPVGLGPVPTGAKAREGDGKTPEGVYWICLVKPGGRHGRSLGLSYPNAVDAYTALQDNAIDAAAYRAILDAQTQGCRPPWGTALGGEIYIHEGGADRDWTQGCVAMNPADMDRLFAVYPQIEQVEILP